MSEKRNVPELRFPEFMDDWETVELSTVTNKISVGIATEVRPYVSQLKEVPILRNQNIKAGYFDDSDIEYITKEFDETNRTKRVKANDLLIVRTGSNIGNACVVPVDYENSQTFTTLIVRPRSSALNSEFLSQHVNFKGLSEIARLSAGAGKPNLNAGFLKRYRISIPSLEEQKKITEFLAAVDKRIEWLQAKKEKLEAYKKEVMQQIFSQKLRFKADDGSEFPDWEEKKLGEVLDYEQPTKYLVSSTEYSNSFSTPVLTAGKTFLLGYTDETTGIFEKKLPTIIFDDFTTAFQFVDFPFKAKSSAMKMLVPKDSSVNMVFVHEAMCQIKHVPGDHKRHWISEYQEFEIPYPSEAEQEKIVQFLTSLNSIIGNLNQQINHTQTWKKGLLQKMFV